MNKNLIVNEKEISLGKVFRCELSDDKKEIIFTECCDYYYSECLSAIELQILIDSLQKMHAQMIK